MNIWDILLGVAVVAVLALAARKLILDRKRGRLSCGGDCARCMRGCGVRRS